MSATERLQGKVAVITGANSGIGLATAKLFIAEGADVVITGRRADAVASAASELGPKATGVVADAGSVADIEKMVAEIKEKFGRIDVLFLNAGVAPMSPFVESDEAMFDRVYDTNVKGPFFAIQKALPILSQGASVFINASIVTYKGLPGTSVYSSSKGAVRTLVRVLATELAARGIRVNALSPGPIGTPLWGKTGLDESHIDEMGGEVAKGVPLGRFGAAEEMATVALFLASDESSYVTGADIQADGGFAQV